EGWRLITSSWRVLSKDPLLESKTCSKVRSVLARAEAEEAGADEALLPNERGEVAEGAATNVFWVSDGCVLTPPLWAGLLPGVTRTAIVELCEERRSPTGEREITPKGLCAADGVFVTLSTLGVVEAMSLDGSPLKRSPLTRVLSNAYWELVRRETAKGG
ncbi:MAG: aminotransferase class IV, partial [Acidobacteriales bacterium]|nr:aminotransferase class IV [Terriglobales bacterium]